MKISVKIKILSMNDFEKVVNRIKEIEKVNPHMTIDIEVDCRKRLFSFPNFK